METDEKKKIYAAFAAIALIISFFGVGYLLGIRNASAGNENSVSGAVERAADSVDRTAERLDDASDSIRDAEKTADDISRTGAEIGNTVDEIKQSDSQFETGLDDVTKIVDRCQERNNRIAEILSSAESTSGGSRKAESITEKAK